jgi:hypothetical protein
MKKELAEAVFLEQAAVIDEAIEQARSATEHYLAQHGEQGCCGFAWVNVYGVRSNSKLGKLLAQYGFKPSWERGVLQLWNPSGAYTQCINAKEVGADVCAEILRTKLGITAYSGSRLD